MHTDDESRENDAGGSRDTPRRARRITGGGQRAVAALAAILLLALVAVGATAQSARAVTRHEAFAPTPTPTRESTEAPTASAKPSASATSTASATPTASPTPAPSLDWHGPSDGDYPDIADAADLWIDVDLTAQRVRIKDGDTTLYTMICSSGIDDTTPKGTFAIGTRGDFFYNRTEGMGAWWWVGFKGTTYLFHTVPTDLYGNYIESEAEKLGAPASHGCVRLTVADAKWIYDTIPEGTKVVIA